MRRFIAIMLFLVFMILLSTASSAVPAFVYQGHIKNSTGAFVGGANVSISVINPISFMVPIAVWSNLTNASGFFQITVWNDTGVNLFKPVIRIYSGSTVLEIGPTLPEFPSQVFSAGLNNSNMTTQAAATFNITTYINISANITNASGIFFDTKFGFPIAQFNDVNGTLIYAPAGRNYSLTLWRTNMDVPPKTFTITNLSSYSSPITVQMMENMSSSFYTVSGYAVITENTTPVNFSTYYLYSFINNQVMLGNAYYQRTPTDVYNSSGFFNFTMPGPSTPMLIALYANDSSRFFVGFSNVSPSGNTEVNITLKTLAGVYRSDSNVVNTSTTTIAIKDGSTGAGISGGAFVQAQTTYDNLSITWMMDVSLDSANISFWNSSTAVISIFNSNAAPRKLRATPALLNTNTTLTVFLQAMEMKDDDGVAIDVGMLFYTSNSTCDVPNPPAGCIMMNFSDDEEFNPMQALLGGAVSMRFVQPTGLVIHYANVDLLSSGPPDAMLSTDSQNATTSSGLEAAWKFGSKGPDMYGYLLIGMPYSDVSFDETGQINISIPVLYDEDWNVQWNVSTMGTAVNITEYADYSSNWFTGMRCTAAANLSQGQNCSLDTTNNMVWVRFPHFSAVGPKMSGSARATSSSSSSSSSSTSGGGSGGGGGGVLFSGSGVVSLYNGEFLQGESLKVDVSGTTYYFKITAIGTDSVALSFAPSIKTLTVGVGETARIDVNNDGTDDISTKLNRISEGKAFMKVERILTAAPAGAAVANETPGQQATAPSEVKADEAVPAEGQQDLAAAPEESTESEPAAYSTRSKAVGTAIILVLATLAALIIHRRRKVYPEA